MRCIKQRRRHGTSSRCLTKDRVEQKGVDAAGGHPWQRAAASALRQEPGHPGERHGQADKASRKGQTPRWKETRAPQLLCGRLGWSQLTL